MNSAIFLYPAFRASRFRPVGAAVMARNRCAVRNADQLGEVVMIITAKRTIMAASR
jgi:hypothetical protein